MPNERFSIHRPSLRRLLEAAAIVWAVLRLFYHNLIFLVAGVEMTFGNISPTTFTVGLAIFLLLLIAGLLVLPAKGHRRSALSLGTVMVLFDIMLVVYSTGPAEGDGIPIEVIFMVSLALLLGVILCRPAPGRRPG